MIGTRMTTVLAIVFCCSPYAGAALTSGFETGDLTGWTATGPVDVVTEQYARDFLGLTQPPSGDIWYPAQGNYFASLWSTDSAGTNAASLSVAFDAAAGDVLDFDYFFDYGDYAPYYDSATGSLSWTGGSTVLFQHNTSGHELADDQNIGWTRVSYTLPATGTYTLQFATQDGLDSFESILGIDSVAVGPAIPAPGAGALCIVGISLLGRFRRRRAARTRGA